MNDLKKMTCADTEIKILLVSGETFTCSGDVKEAIILLYT